MLVSARIFKMFKSSRLLKSCGSLQSTENPNLLLAQR